MLVVIWLSLSSLYNDDRHRMVIIADVEEKLVDHEMPINTEYIRCGLLHIKRNHLCFHSLVSSIFIMLFQTICENVFPLFFAMKGSNLRSVTECVVCAHGGGLVLKTEDIKKIFTILLSKDF